MSSMKILFIAGWPVGTKGTPGTYKLIETFSNMLSCKVISTKIDSRFSVQDVFNFDLVALEDMNTLNLLQLQEDINIFDPDVVWIFNHPEWYEYAKTVKIINKDIPIVLDIKTPLLVTDERRRYIQEAGNTSAHFVDKIFTLDKFSALSWIPEYNGKIVEYPLGIDIENFNKFSSEVSENSISSKKNWHKEVTTKYVYIGAIHEKRKLEPMLDAFIEFARQSLGKVLLDVYGNGPALETLQEYVANKSATSYIEFKGLVDFERLVNLIPKYDIGIAWVPREIYNHSPSLKILEYFASRLTVIATNTEAHKKLQDEKFELFYCDDTKEDLLHTLMTTKKLDKRILQSNYELVQKYNYKSIVETYFLPALNKINKKRNDFLNIIILSDTLALGKGGVERVSMELADEMTRRGHIVSVAYKGPRKPAYKSHYGVLNLPYENINDVRSILENIRPDAYFCFYFNRNLIAFYKQVHGLPIAFGMQECTNPERLVGNNWFRPDRKKALALWEREILGAMASRIRLVMPSYKESFPKYIQRQIYAFSNPSRKIDEGDESVQQENVILSVNGFKGNKNFLTLVKAFELIHKKYPEWKIVDIGKEPNGKQDHKKEIIRFIEENRIEEKVQALGPVDNVDAYFSKAKIHVIASLSEGCPTVILEAMAHGVPSIGFGDCPGTNELIKHNRNGLLVGDGDRVVGLATALEKLISNIELRKELSENAYVDSKFYNATEIYNMWEQLFYDMSKYSKNSERLLEEQLTVDPKSTLHSRNMIDQLLSNL